MNQQQQLEQDYISQDSLSFDPYDLNTQTTDKQPQYYQEQSSQDSQIQFYDRKQLKQVINGQEQSQEPAKIKGNKVYHENTFTKLDTKINLHKINNEIGSMQAKQLIKQKKNKDKADRATVQQVLDQRTRRILLKLLNNDIVSEINGCISTGKEANVYHAINNTTKKQYAIKIYKTSILIFKDRDRYVQGEFRFRRGYCSSNPRKMVTMWAEKQLRNLKRMEGIVSCPVGLLVKSNVLVMDFLGKDMINAPRLKDAQIKNIQQWSNLYLQVVKIMRILYQQCKLIHADLSEYNMLYYQNKIYVIDVSQSVQHDHPHSLDFLRRDITNINDFFRKKHVNVFSDWNLFQFIVALGIQRGQELKQLQNIMDQLQQEKIKEDSTNVEDNIFKKISIPRTLGNISMEKVEKDLFGQTNEKKNYHHIVTGIEDKVQEDKNVIKEVDNDDDNSHSSSSSSDSDSQNDQQDETIKKNEGSQVKILEDGSIQPLDGKGKGGKQKYEGLSKLQRKHKVKEQKRQKRKDKLPKKQKKRLTKKH